MSSVYILNQHLLYQGLGAPHWARPTLYNA